MAESSLDSVTGILVVFHASARAQIVVFVDGTLDIEFGGTGLRPYAEIRTSPCEHRVMHEVGTHTILRLLDAFKGVLTEISGVARDIHFAASDQIDGVLPAQVSHALDRTRQMEQEEDTPA